MGATLLAGLACGSATSDGERFEAGGYGGDGVSGSGGLAGSGSGGILGTGGSGMSGSAGSVSLDGSPGSGGTGVIDDACAAESHRAKETPLDLYLMVDKSGSMDSGGSGKWAAVVAAIGGFVQQSPQTDGIGVGLNFFPGKPSSAPIDACAASCTTCQCVQACGCNGCSCTNNVCTCPAGAGGQSCDPIDYATPTVEIGVLPGVSSAIISSLNAQKPAGGTPTRPALEGAIVHAKDWASANAGHKVVVVLATDGAPSEQECTPNTVADSVNLAAAAFAGSPSIVTFVIGVGNSLTALNQIAAAGGSQSAFLVDTSLNVKDQFIDAMNKIRGIALACEYEIPLPATGQLDFNKVNVQYAQGGGQAGLIHQVPNAAACDPVKGGWYYDDPSNPTRIIACKASCDSFNAASGGQVDIVLGCTTITEPPH